MSGSRSAPNVFAGRVYFDLTKAKEKLHLLKGLAKILLDIDKAIRIIRSTEVEAEVIPNLMIGFGIDEIQAEYVAEIRLRHLNREYILKRTRETDKLEQDIAEMEELLNSRTKIRRVMIGELQEVAKTYGQPRRSELIFAQDILTAEEVREEIPDYPCTLFFTAEGYFKKITPQSLRMSSEHKLKEGDRIAQAVEASNNRDLLFFSNKGTVYKAKASDFGDTKASAMGDFVATKLGFDEGETAIHMVVTTDYSGYLLFFFENGKVAKVELSAYATKTTAASWWGRIPTNRAGGDRAYCRGSGVYVDRVLRTAAAGAYRRDRGEEHPQHTGCAGDDAQTPRGAGKGGAVPRGYGGEARAVSHQNAARRGRDAASRGYRRSS